MRPLSFLVVDDQVSVCEGIAALLRSEGHSVVTSYTALDAVALLAGQTFDVALIDYVLGENSTMSGVNVARHGPSTLVRVAMTGYDAEMLERTAGESLPFDRVLEKPCGLRELREMIEWVRRMLSDTQP